MEIEKNYFFYNKNMKIESETNNLNVEKKFKNIFENRKKIFM